MTAFRFAWSIFVVVSAAGCLGPERAPPPPAPFAGPPAAATPDRAALLESEVARLRSWLVAREAHIDEISLEEAALTQQLQDAAQLNDEMSGRLRLSAQSLEQLAAERERLTSELADARARLEALETATSSPEVPASRIAPAKGSGPSLVDVVSAGLGAELLSEADGSDDAGANESD